MERTSTSWQVLWRPGQLGRLPNYEMSARAKSERRGGSGPALATITPGAAAVSPTPARWCPVEASLLVSALAVSGNAALGPCRVSCPCLQRSACDICPWIRAPARGRRRSGPMMVVSPRALGGCALLALALLAHCAAVEPAADATNQAAGNASTSGPPAAAPPPCGRPLERVSRFAGPAER